MNKTIEALEKRRLQDVAREYRKMGYEVLLDPSSDDLPSFLSDFQLDMIALSNTENVVVEVKSKSTLSRSNYLTALASAVNSQPRWRFELVVTNPVAPPVAAETAVVLSTSQVEQRIQAVRQLLDSNQADAAMVLVWSAVEAVLRRFAHNEGLAQTRNPLPQLVKEIYSLGLLSREDYDLLEEGMRLRNLTAHGFQSTESTAELVAGLIELVGSVENHSYRIAFRGRMRPDSLLRIEGLAEEYADLLEVAGVDTLRKLAREDPTNLHKKLIEVNEEKKLVRKLPSEAYVEDWIEAAGNLQKTTYVPSSGVLRKQSSDS